MAILTWRNIADSAGPCDAGGGPMTEGNLSGPRRASQSTALLSTHWSAAMHGSSVQDEEAPLLLYEFLPPSQQLNHHQLPSGLPAPLLVADVMGGSDPFLDTPIPPIYPHNPPPRSIIENSSRWMRLRRRTGVRNNIHHLSQHLSPPVSLILSPQGLISQST